MKNKKSKLLGIGIIAVLAVLIIAGAAAIFVNYIMPIGQYELAEGYVASGKYKEAIKIYNTLGKYKDSQELLYKYGEECARELVLADRDYKGAIEVLEMLEEKDEDLCMLYGYAKAALAAEAVISGDEKGNEVLTELVSGEYVTGVYSYAQVCVDNKEYAPGEIVLKALLNINYKDSATMLEELVVNYPMAYVKTVKGKADYADAMIKKLNNGKTAYVKFLDINNDAMAELLAVETGNEHAIVLYSYGYDEKGVKVNSQELFAKETPDDADCSGSIILYSNENTLVFAENLLNADDEAEERKNYSKINVDSEGNISIEKAECYFDESGRYIKNFGSEEYEKVNEEKYAGFIAECEKGDGAVIVTAEEGSTLTYVPETLTSIKEGRAILENKLVSGLRGIENDESVKMNLTDADLLEIQNLVEFMHSRAIADFEATYMTDAELGEIMLQLANAAPGFVGEKVETEGELEQRLLNVNDYLNKVYLCFNRTSRDVLKSDLLTTVNETECIDVGKRQDESVASHAHVEQVYELGNSYYYVSYTYQQCKSTEEPVPATALRSGDFSTDEYVEENVKSGYCVVGVRNGVESGKYFVVECSGDNTEFITREGLEKYAG